MPIASNIRIMQSEGCMFADYPQAGLLVGILNMFVCKRIINQVNRHHHHLPVHSSERNIEFRFIYTTS